MFLLLSGPFCWLAEQCAGVIAPQYASLQIKKNNKFTAVIIILCLLMKYLSQVMFLLALTRGRTERQVRSGKHEEMTNWPTN